MVRIIDISGQIAVNDERALMRVKCAGFLRGTYGIQRNVRTLSGAA